MSALRYTFKDGRKLFVSKKTVNEGANALLSSSLGILQQCETVNSFKRFDSPHTGKAIGEWLVSEHEAKGLLPQYVVFHCTDGASNAVASANVYDLLTELNRETPIDHVKCLAHQTNRSAKFASGTGDFRDNANPRLSKLLLKCHTIIARVQRSSARIKVVKDVQIESGRTKAVLPSPGVPTRWDSTNREVASVNRIMNDYNKALHLLINGIDHGKLTPKVGEALPITNFTFTPNDKMILRQFEIGSRPCVLLSKFFQINDATSHETIFVTLAYLLLMQQTSFVMYDETIQSEVAVVSSLHVASECDGFRTEVVMDPCIELYRLLYSKDMLERCGFTDQNGDPCSELPRMTAIALLLNPLFGGR